VTANGIAIEHESFGPAKGEPVLLIMGLGAQMTRWPLPFIDLLVERGYRVIRFDNRDVGLSEKFHAAGPSDIQALMGEMFAGRKPQAPYELADMAADAVGVLDALGIARAHIVGASMGGMIAQLVAALYPERTLSLTSIMSTTGSPAVPPGKPEAMAVLTTRPASDSLEDIVAHGVKAQLAIGSPGYPADEAALRERILADYERSNYIDGFSRQVAAIMACGDRRALLKNIAAPTVVFHGADDPLVPIEGGRDTADNINGAELRIVPGMGHDLPPQLFATVVDAIESAAARSRATV
jgi:pimeloyl-ACP methyl ester carboxylesterase